MTKYQIVICPEAHDEHCKSKRQYAHVFHLDGKICVAKEFLELPRNIQLALLLHEVGHILAYPNGGERVANWTIEHRTGIPLGYIDTKYGRDLEWIDKKYEDDSIKFLDKYLIKVDEHGN